MLAALTGLRWTERDWKVVFIYLRKLEFASSLEKV